jgi:glycosyltransferase involved in cell wall biosynthesis
MHATLVIPVYNEEEILCTNIGRLVEFTNINLPCTHDIIIANNGSTDSTLECARALSKRYQNVSVLSFEEKGRGRALRESWLRSKGDILAYMDADLSTDLSCLSHLLEPLKSKDSDLVIGSRLLKHELTVRCLEREILSRVYNGLVQRLLATSISDVQCGFKAMSRSAAQHILPLVQDTSWFFDTELTIRAERLGYRISEIAVRWVERTGSHVRIIPTICEDLRGLVRLRASIRSDSAARTLERKS